MMNKENIPQPKTNAVEKRRVSFASQQHTYLYDTSQQIPKKSSPLKPKPSNRTPPRNKHVEQGSPMMISPNNGSEIYDTDESINTTTETDSPFGDRVDGVDDLMDILAERTKDDKRLSSISMYSDEDMEFTSTTGKIYSFEDEQEHNTTQQLDHRMSLATNYGDIMYADPNVRDRRMTENRMSLATIHGGILFADDEMNDPNRTRRFTDNRMSMATHHGDLLYVGEENQQLGNAFDNRMSMGTMHGNILFVAPEDQNDTQEEYLNQEHNKVSQDQTMDLNIRLRNLQSDHVLSSEHSQTAPFNLESNGAPRDTIHRFHNASMELTNVTGKILSTHESVLEEQTREILTNIQRLSTVDPNMSIINHSLLSIASPAVINPNNRSIVDGSFRISPPKAGVFDDEEDFEHTYQDSLIYDDDEVFGNPDDGSIANYTLDDFMHQFQIHPFHDNVTNRRMTMIHRDEGKRPETKEEILQLLCITSVEKESVEKMKMDLIAQIEILSQKVRQLENNFEQNNPPICTLAQHIPEQSSRKFKRQLSILRSVCNTKADLRLIDWKIEMKKSSFDRTLNHFNKLTNGDVKKLNKYMDHVKSLINELEATLQEEKIQQQIQASKISSQISSQDNTSSTRLTRPVESPKPTQDKRQTDLNYYSVLRSIGGDWDPLVVKSNQFELRYRCSQQLGCDFTLSINLSLDQVSAINFGVDSREMKTNDRQLQLRNSLLQHYFEEARRTCDSHVNCNINTIPKLTQTIALNLSRIQSIWEEIQEIALRFSSTMYITTSNSPQLSNGGVPVSFVFSSRKHMKRFTLTMVLSSQYPYEPNLVYFNNDLGPTTEQQVKNVLAYIPVNRFGRLVRIASDLSALLVS